MSRLWPGPLRGLDKCTDSGPRIPRPSASRADSGAVGLLVCGAGEAGDRAPGWSWCHGGSGSKALVYFELGIGSFLLSFFFF